MNPAGGSAPRTRAICGGQPDRIDQVLARHLVIDAERMPAHRPIGLPLQLAMPARHRRLELLAGRGIAPADRRRRRVMAGDRHLHDDAGSRMNGQERRIGRRSLLAQRGQHDRLHLLEALEHAQQRRVETPGSDKFRSKTEFVVEAEAVEKGRSRALLCAAKLGYSPNGSGTCGQRLAEMGCDQVAVGDVVRDLAQAVHVVGKGDQPRLDRIVGQHAKGVAHHGRARDFAERAEMRQARRSVTGLEDHFFARRARHALDQFSRFFERPGL